MDAWGWISLVGAWWQQHVAKQRDGEIVGSMHICHMARLRRVCNVRLNIKVTDQESQENMVKEQDMELAGWVRNSLPSFGVGGLGTYWV